MKKFNLFIYFLAAFSLYFFIFVSVTHAAGTCGTAGKTGTNPYTANSISQDNVDACLGQVNEGNTVNVPAGTIAWSSGVTVPTGVILHGAGIGNTVITSNDFITVYLNNSSRISGFEFTNGVALPTSGRQNWVADYCKFTAVIYDSGAQIIDSTSQAQHSTGVYHKCTIEHIRFIVRGTAYPDRDWYTYYPNINNYTNTVYFEGCTFVSTDDYTNGVDNSYGGNRVLRFNTIKDMPNGFHGGRDVYLAAGRGGALTHIYRNIWDHTGGTVNASYAYKFRSGTGILFDNYCSYAGNSGCNFQYEIERAAEYGYYETCSAETVADTAPHPEGGSPAFLCRDGIGAGRSLGPDSLSGTTVIYSYGQESKPIYVWNHKINDATANISLDFGVGNYIAENRDFFRSGGSNGVTTGLYGNRPTCNSGRKNHGYWATDMGGDWNTTDEWSGADGALYVCDGASTWNLYFTPIPYPHPLLSETPQTCTYTYSAWSACQSDNTQTRTVISSSPSGCTGTPVLTQSCVYTNFLPEQYIQAEAGTLSGMQSGISGSDTYIYTASDNSGSAAFTFNITTAGQYKTEAKVNSNNDSGQNSFYVGLDSEAAQNNNYYAYATPVISGFVWDNVNRTGNGTTLPEFDPMTWTLSAGLHTFTFYGREANTWLDQIILKRVTADTTPPAAPTGLAVS